MAFGLLRNGTRAILRSLERAYPYAPQNLGRCTSCRSRFYGEAFFGCNCFPNTPPYLYPIAVPNRDSTDKLTSAQRAIVEGLRVEYPTGKLIVRGESIVFVSESRTGVLEIDIVRGVSRFHVK